MRIGITEMGDASIDYSWVQKLDNVDGAILITKNVTDRFIEAVLQNYNKVIVHATTTGYGGTILEPNVMPVEKTMNQLEKLMNNGFSFRKIIMRVDPIIPTEKGIVTAESVIRQGYGKGIRRFRISVIDMYPHVRERFKKARIKLPYGEGFSASDTAFTAVDDMCQRLYNDCAGISIECCAEPKLNIPKHIGCISSVDFKVLGLPKPQEAEHTKGYQRKECLCCSCKTELLNNRYRCPNGCLYCYWKDK